MGHSSIQITVDTYGHLIPGADIAWVDRLDSKTTQQLNATQAQPEEEEAFEDVAKDLISWRALRDSNSRPTDSKSWLKDSDFPDDPILESIIYPQLSRTEALRQSIEKGRIGA